MAFNNLDSKDYKFVVVGGGTSGWLTALFLRKEYPNVSITLIESSEIGILGAGEGSTPHLVNFLQELNISASDIVKHAGGTIKNGIKFTNWNGDNKYYYHGFSTDNYSVNYNQNTTIGQSILSLEALERIANREPLNKIDLTYITCEDYTTKFVVSSNIENKTQDNTYHFDILGPYALHFNAVMLADFLKFVGKARNIKVIESTVSKINTDKEGNITSLTLINADPTIRCDFVFDCSGFKRKIIGDFFNNNWKSYKEYLPVNKSMTFFSPIKNGEIPPYTEAIAMKYGWMWKIPLQDRYGCGYVFDSNQIDDESIKKEIDEYTGTDTVINRQFTFEAGQYETPWIKNCVAIGLAAGFIEPLEATSIWVTISSLRYFSQHIRGLIFSDPYQMKSYNDSVLKLNQEILNFIYFHYLTERTDTPFWANFNTNNKAPEMVQKLLDNNDALILSNVTESGINNIYFTIDSWLQVGTGINFYDCQKAKEAFDSFNIGIRKIRYKAQLQKYIKNIQLVRSSLINHKTLLSYLSERY